MAAVEVAMSRTNGSFVEGAAKQMGFVPNTHCMQSVIPVNMSHVAIYLLCSGWYN